MLYVRITLHALFAAILAGSTVRPPQAPTREVPAPIRHLNLRLEKPMYLALYRPTQFTPTDMSAVVILPGDDNGMASLRVKTRASI